ncbi:imidazolonepropionase [Citrobacter koseri]|nr:imidazolonepropionase [Citrobacter koseri]
MSRYQGLSADHIEYLDKAGVAAMSRSGTVGVLLPGAFYFLKETQRPPVALLRHYGVPMAVATDFNPGTSPFISFASGDEHGLRTVWLNAGRGVGGRDAACCARAGAADDAWAIESGICR